MHLRTLILTLTLPWWLAACSTLTPIPEKRLATLDSGAVEYATTGNAKPMIVFISGGGPAEMNTWGEVYREARNISSVFAYNRYGDGKSARTDVPQTGKRVVATLRAALRAAGSAPPYVLVGHSLGGLYANLYARLHPAEVAGVVLVDSSHPDQGELNRGAYQGWFMRGVNGVLLGTYSLINPTKYSEFTSFAETVAEYRAAGPFPDVPLIVISAGQRAPISPEGVQFIERLQQNLVGLSPQGRRIIAEGSGHRVPIDRPDVVVEAIRDVVEAARR